MDAHGRMNFDIGSPVHSNSPSAIIGDDEIAPTSTSDVSEAYDSPRRRFGDLSGIVMDQPVAQVARMLRIRGLAPCRTMMSHCDGSCIALDSHMVRVGACVLWR